MTAGAIATRNAALATGAPATLSGVVRDGFGNPVAGVSVRLLDTPLVPSTTATDGSYTITGVPRGSHEVGFSPPDQCHRGATVDTEVTGATTLDAALGLVVDASGRFCTVETPAYIAAGTVLSLTGDEVNTTVTLPFAFPFYGTTQNAVNVTDNGLLTFLPAPENTAANLPIPSVDAPNALIAPFWDDLVIDELASVRTASLSGPTRFVIEWRNVYFYDFSTGLRVDFEVVLYEDGRILFQYRNILDNNLERGAGATIGIEDATGGVGLQYGYPALALDAGKTAVMFHPPDTELPTGTFRAPRYTNSTTLTVTVTGTDNVGVNGYLIRQSRMAPLADDPGWSSRPPVSFTVSPGDGPKVLRLWVRDSLGNVSKAIAPSRRTTLDTTLPTVSLAMPARTKSRTVAVTVGASDDGSGIAGYYLSEKPRPPAAAAAKWRTRRPTSFVLSARDGTKTVYAFTKDAAGNVSLAASDTTRLATGTPGAGSSAPSLTTYRRITARELGALRSWL